MSSIGEKIKSEYIDRIFEIDLSLINTLQLIADAISFDPNNYETAPILGKAYLKAWELLEVIGEVERKL